MQLATYLSLPFVCNAEGRDLAVIDYWIRPNGERDQSCLYSCMLKFNEESAPAWGGPFPGNYACAFIVDYRLKKNYKLSPEQQPILLYVHGTDDTSYHLRFSSAEEAIELIRLLEACADSEPLDLYKDFFPCGFIPD